MESLVVFAKSPYPGQVKTRLARSLSHDDEEERGRRAAVLYAAFLDALVPALSTWRRQRAGVDQNRRLVLYCAPNAEDPLLLDVARRAGAHVRVQVEGDLGTKLQAAFDAEYERGARAVCAIGTDAPTLEAHQFDHAFRALLFEKAVLGPTFDGGYWLIGAQRPGLDLFSDMPWSTSSVTDATLRRARELGEEVKLLPFWYDVDEAEDLARLKWHLEALSARDPARYQRVLAALSV